MTQMSTYAIKKVYEGLGNYVLLLGLIKSRSVRSELVKLFDIAEHLGRGWQHNESQ